MNTHVNGVYGHVEGICKIADLFIKVLVFKAICAYTANETCSVMFSKFKDGWLIHVQLCTCLIKNLMFLNNMSYACREVYTHIDAVVMLYRYVVYSFLIMS